MLRPLAAAFLILCAAAAARAEGTAVSIRVVIPEGYCAFTGPDAVERVMARVLRDSVARENGVLLESFTSCRHLEAVRNMQATFYEEYVTVAAYPQAAPRLRRQKRAAFIRALVADAGKRGWKAATEAIMHWESGTGPERRGRIGIDIVKPPRLLAQETDAVYLAATAFIYTRDDDFDSTVVFAITSADGVPVGIAAASRNDGSGPRLYEAIRATTEALIAANP